MTKSAASVSSPEDVAKVTATVLTASRLRGVAPSLGAIEGDLTPVQCRALVLLASRDASSVSLLDEGPAVAAARRPLLLVVTNLRRTEIAQVVGDLSREGWQRLRLASIASAEAN